MSTEPIYLVTDAGSPVTAFTTKDEMKAYLKRRRGTLNRPLVYRIDGEGHAPVIMTLARAMGEWGAMRRPARTKPSGAPPGAVQSGDPRNGTMRSRSRPQSRGCSR
jgi:hypothetical protein